VLKRKGVSFRDSNARFPEMKKEQEGAMHSPFGAVLAGCGKTEKGISSGAKAHSIQALYAGAEAPAS
jgi:hypothetical protein